MIMGETHDPKTAEETLERIRLNKIEGGIVKMINANRMKMDACVQIFQNTKSDSIKESMRTRKNEFYQEILQLEEWLETFDEMPMA